MSITATLWRKHWILERNSLLLLLGILIVIAIGGLVEIVPLFYLKSTIESAPGMRRSSSPVATSMCAKAATSAIRK
jgi:cbb3-type cytochrome oxidase cytochrome c subunit